MRSAGTVEISLTDFVDFTVRTGPSKVTKVKEIKYRTDYEPAVDFWRHMRDGIVQLHRRGNVDRRALDAIVAAETHATKQRLYPAAAAGYARFLGRRPQEFFEPPRGLWREGRLAVRVNPEIGLMRDGHPVVIKLYFREEELSSARVQASIGVMAAELGNSAGSDARFGVLDVRAGKLLVADGRWNTVLMNVLIRGEARSFVEMWDAV